MPDDVIPLNEIGKIGTVKVYNQAYVDKQQKRIAELEAENAEAKELLKGIVDTPMYNQIGGEMSENKEYKELIAEAEQFLGE